MSSCDFVLTPSVGHAPGDMGGLPPLALDAPPLGLAASGLVALAASPAFKQRPRSLKEAAGRHEVTPLREMRCVGRGRCAKTGAPLALFASGNAQR